ncbi:MAG: AsnC family protein [Deltaproteobacteria bacterium]|nr:MAG: AsnC family protein [Deltaproteobacteria bacterium]
MDKTDKLIINYIQSDFPMSERPYKEAGENLGIEESEIIKRVQKLKDSGVIRRIGGNFYPDKLGFHSTLCAACVPEDLIEKFTEIVNGYRGVTHNYIREDVFNIWFTFIAPSTEAIRASLEEIKKMTGVSIILNLPATDVYKIRAEFKIL